jgi:hypothetical protein
MTIDVFFGKGVNPYYGSFRSLPNHSRFPSSLVAPACLAIASWRRMKLREGG